MQMLIGHGQVPTIMPEASEKRRSIVEALLKKWKKGEIQL